MKTAPTARDGLLTAATDLMLSKGFAATRVEEICAAAGVSKGSFYHFFVSKEDLGLEVVEAFYRREIERLIGGREARRGGADAQGPDDGDPVAALFRLVDHVHDVGEDLWRRGSLLGSFASSLSDTNPTIRDEISRMFTTLAVALAPSFEAFLDRCGRPGDPSALELAEQMLATIEGSVVLSRAHGDPGRISQGLRLFRRSLELMAER